SWCSSSCWRAPAGSLTRSSGSTRRSSSGGRRPNGTSPRSGKRLGRPSWTRSSGDYGRGHRDPAVAKAHLAGRPDARRRGGRRTAGVGDQDQREGAQQLREQPPPFPARVIAVPTVPELKLKYVVRAREG